MLLVAAAALVDEENRVLLATRPEGKQMAGLWEFPGGKVNADETPEEALVRELREELGIVTAPCCLSPGSFVTYNPDRLLPVSGCNPLADWNQEEGEILLLMLYICRRWHGIPQAREGQQLRWVRPVEMFSISMPPADKPLVAILPQLL